MNQTRLRKNLAESILARAELFRRGMLFEGVPSMATPVLEMPAQPGAMAAPGAGAVADPSQAAPPADPAATDTLVAGSVEGQTPLQSILAGP